MRIEFFGSGNDRSYSLALKTVSVDKLCEIHHCRCKRYDSGRALVVNIIQAAPHLFISEIEAVEHLAIEHAVVEREFCLSNKRGAANIDAPYIESVLARFAIRPLVAAFGGSHASFITVAIERKFYRDSSGTAGGLVRDLVFVISGHHVLIAADDICSRADGQLAKVVWCFDVFGTYTKLIERVSVIGRLLIGVIEKLLQVSPLLILQLLIGLPLAGI